jgi:hypothetical protein
MQHASATYVAIFREVFTRMQLQLQKFRNHSSIENNYIEYKIAVKREL